MKKKIVILLLLHCIGFAQYKNTGEEVKKIFPNDDVVLLKNAEKMEVDIINGKLSIIIRNEQETIYLNNKISSLGALERSVSYSPFFTEISELEAASFIPNGNKFVKNTIIDFKTEKSKSSSVFYDDVLEKKFIYAGITKGAVTTLKYNETIKNPFMIGSFMFGNYIPTKAADYSITFPASIKIAFKTFGNLDGIVFKQSEKNGKTTYSWHSKNIKPIPIESKSLNIRHLVPQIIPYIESFSIDGNTTEVLGNDQKLFNHYKEMVKGINLKPNNYLINLSDSLTKGKSEIEKIKSIYYWVQDNVKYIAFEEGMGGFVPREANDICQKRYGDCKDMASLITTMLKIAGIQSNLVWVGTRDIPFTYAENPTLSVDNHMIAAVNYNKNWIFLDATDDHIDFGLPTTHIQGKEAMMMTYSGDFEILNIPVVDSKTNSRKDEINIKIDNNILTGDCKSIYEGNWKGELMHQLNSYSDKQKTSFFENTFRLGSNKCKVINPQLIGLKSRENPLEFNYSIALPDYIKLIDNDLYFNPHLIKHLTAANEIDVAKRKGPIEADYKWSENTIIKIEIPEGFKVEELPTNQSFVDSKFSFNIDYSKTKNQIIINQQTNYDVLVLKNDNFEAFNKMVKLMTSTYGELITFKKL